VFETASVRACGPSCSASPSSGRLSSWAATAAWAGGRAATLDSSSASASSSLGVRASLGGGGSACCVGLPPSPTRLQGSSRLCVAAGCVAAGCVAAGCVAAGCVAAGSSSSAIGWAPASLQPWSEGGGTGLVGRCSDGSLRHGLAEAGSSTEAASGTAVAVASGGGWAWTAHSSAGAAAAAAAATAATAAAAVAAAAAPTGVLAKVGVLPCGVLAGAGGVVVCSGTSFEATASGAPGLAGARPEARSSTSLTRGVEACGDGGFASARRGDASSGEGARTVASSWAEASAAATAAASSAEAAAAAAAAAGDPTGGVDVCSDCTGAEAPVGDESGSEASCGCVGDTTGGSSTAPSCDSSDAALNWS